jgi:Holliday junction resolvase RusA-like endonuclease
MTEEIRFTVFGIAASKGRSQTVRLKTGASHTYTPAATVAWEESVVGQALAHRPADGPWEGPLGLGVTFFRSMPKSVPKRDRATALPATRPDIDNNVKAITDALQGIIWLNDAQLVDVEARKRYGVPRVEIRIWRAQQHETEATRQ